MIIERIEKLLDSLAHRPLWRVAPTLCSPQGAPYATFNRRMLASMIDAAILTLLLLPFNDAIMAYVYGGLQIDPSMPMEQTLSALATPDDVNRLAAKMLGAIALLSQIQYLVMAAYSFICWHFWSATPGKLVLGMRIVDAKTGAPVGDWQSFVRLMGYIVSGVPLMAGFFAISWSKTRQGWHDHMAGTVVVAITRKPAGLC